MFSKKRFEILFVNVSVIPVVDFFEGKLVVKLLTGFYTLFLLFHKSVKGYFLFEQLGESRFHSGTELLAAWHAEIGPHCNLSSEIGVIDGHYYL